MQFEITNVFSKLKGRLNLDKDRELAKAMGVHVSTFSSWKSRNAIDFIFLLDFCRKNNISLDWLFEFDTQNAISEPETKYESKEIKELESLKTRIEILERDMNNYLKEGGNGKKPNK